LITINYIVSEAKKTVQTGIVLLINPNNGKGDGKMKTKPIFTVALVMALSFGLLGLGLPSAMAKMTDKEKEEARADIQKTSKETLQRLYKAQPGARKAIDNAAGYAVFSNFGMKILFAGSGKGAGMALDKKTGKVTYMKMFEIQAGLGLGVKKFRLVWVFENSADFNKFVNSGFELGGQATAAAKDAEKGAAYTGAISVSPGVWLYQITDKGLAAELTVKGTKYYKNDDLN
jgi:lipid-binding SYLF domain-containing protein